MLAYARNGRIRGVVVRCRGLALSFFGGGALMLVPKVQRSKQGTARPRKGVARWLEECLSISNRQEPKFGTAPL